MFEPVDTSEMFDFPVRDTKVPVEPFNLSKIPYCPIQFELRIPNATRRRYLGPHLLPPTRLHITSVVKRYPNHAHATALFHSANKQNISNVASKRM